MYSQGGGETQLQKNVGFHSVFLGEMERSRVSSLWGVSISMVSVQPNLLYCQPSNER